MSTAADSGPSKVLLPPANRTLLPTVTTAGFVRASDRRDEVTWPVAESYTSAASDGDQARGCSQWARQPATNRALVPMVATAMSTRPTEMALVLQRPCSVVGSGAALTVTLAAWSSGVSVSIVVSAATSHCGSMVSSV